MRDLIIMLIFACGGWLVHYLKMRELKEEIDELKQLTDELKKSKGELKNKNYELRQKLSFKYKIVPMCGCEKTAVHTLQNGTETMHLCNECITLIKETV